MAHFPQSRLGDDIETTGLPAVRLTLHVDCFSSDGLLLAFSFRPWCSPLLWRLSPCSESAHSLSSLLSFVCFFFVCAVRPSRCTMVSLKISSIVCAVLLAGQVDAGHIKKSRFPSHRSQCLPRLTSSVATEVASTLYAHSVSLGSSSSSVILAASEMHHSTSAVNPIPSSIRQTTRSSSTSIHSSAHSTPSSTAAVTSEAHQSSSAVWPISSSADQPTHSALTASTQATTPTTSVITSSSETSTKISPVGETATPLGSSLVPNSNKAGIAGGDAYPFVKDHIGWWYDWYVRL